MYTPPMNITYVGTEEREMSDLQLYHYAVILQPKYDKDDKMVEPGKILIEPTAVLAESADRAQLLAGRAIPEENMDDLDRLTLVVRPF
jgi:hypothetical protein